MPVIAIFSGQFCGAEEVIEDLSRRMDYPVLGSEDLEQAARSRGGRPSWLTSALGGKTSLWDSLTHQQAKGLIHTRDALARVLQDDALIYVGPGTLLIPREITHVLRVCLAAGRAFRLERAVRQEGLSARQAKRRIDHSDKDLGLWARKLFNKGPWNRDLYDLVIPMHSTDPGDAAGLIQRSARSEALKPTRASLQAAMDFSLATQVNLRLLEAGHHYCDVNACECQVTIIINKDVLRVEALAAELERIAGVVEGVSRVTARVGPRYNRPDIYRSFQFQVPEGALLVDDEQEFVLTLSERLEMRDVRSEVVYDGEQALEHLQRKEPAVMVLDLRMPGLGGMEVLRRVKRDHPRVEVIVLTGHGSDEDEQQALVEGAFAFLRKPVDITQLAETMQRASLSSQRAPAGEPTTSTGEDGGGEEGGDT